MRYIHCLNKISQVGLKELPEDYKISDSLQKNVDAILVRSAAMHEMELPKSVKCVARAGAGVNNIPLDRFAKEGVVVFNTPGANANAVKELVIAMMLLACRDIRGSMEWVKANKEDPEINKTMEKAKSAFAGTEILGKTLGVIGCGAIGALVADAASKLGMKVLAVEPSQAVRERNAELLKEAKFVDNDELYRNSDFITIHVPLMDTTRGMLNKDAFSKMKDGVIVINAARDALVNDDDLKVALENGKVRKYVTDFPNHKTANMDGVVAISHLGASTEEAEDNCAAMAARQVKRFLECGNIENSVNYPNLSLGKRTGKRVTVLFENNETVLPVLMKHIKSTNMVNGVKGSFGALVADVSEEPVGLESIPGVIRVLLFK